MPTNINWGIIGLGRIARKFADDLRLLPQARLHAVAATDPERARTFAEAYQVPHHYGHYEAITRCPGLDVVYVATPHPGHAAAALLCLQAGIPVLCEKPFTMNLPEARRLAETAHTQGVFLMEAMWTRFIPAVAQALQWVEQGAIGHVHTVKADFGYKSAFDPASRIFNKALGGGALLDIGIYPAALALMLFGKPAASDIQAAATFTPSGVDESCAFTFQYPGNRLALGHTTVAAVTPVEAWLYGDTGALYLHPRWHHAQRLSLTRYEDNHTETFEFPYAGWGYHFEAAHVMECLQRGLPESPLWPLQRSLDLMEILDTIREKIGLYY